LPDKEDYFILGKRETVSSTPPVEAPPAETSEKKIMVMCASDRMGFGEDALGLNEYGGSYI